MNKQRKIANILNVFQYDAVTGAVVLPNTVTLTAPDINNNSTKSATTAWVRTYVSGLSYITNNQSITVSGDATGSGTTSITLTLANTAVTPGSYGSTTLVPVVTVDSKGRITSVTTAAISGSLTFTGDVTGSGTTGTSTAMTLAASGVTAGTYTKVTVDTKGRVTVGASATTSDISEGTNLYYTDARVLSYLTANTYATQSYVGTQVANLVAAAPATLDTLNELAAALGNDPSFATTVSTSIGTKVPQARTLTINGTAYDLSADRAWTITSMIYPSAGIALSTGTAWGTSITDNSANWNTAFGWGNHASGGYLTSALAATTYASLTGAYANPAFVASLAYSKITGVPAFLTSYTETDPYRVTTVAVSGTSTKTITLTRADASTVTTTWTDYDTDTNTYVTSAGFSGGTLTLTRNDAGTVTVSLDGRYYLATNPSSYISSYTETDTLATVTGRGATTTSTIIINAGAVHSLAISSSQRYQMQVRNTGNSINSGYGWWWFMDTNFNMGFHADGASDRFTLTRDGNLSVSGTLSASNFSGASSGTNTGDQTNISGTAGSISGFNNPTTAATPNTIAYRDASGDLAARELVLNVAVQSFTPSSMVAIYPTTNQAVKVNAAGVQAFLGLGSLAYSSATIPTNNNQLTNGAGYITGISSGNVTTALGYTPVTNARTITINGTGYDLSADRSWTITATETDTLSSVVGRGNTTGGNIISSANMYASVFYDYTDNGYYLDANSYSSLWGLAIRGDNSGTGTTNQITFWGGSMTTTSAIGFKSNGAPFTNPTGNGDGYNTYLTMDTVGRGWVFRRGTGGTDFSAAYTSGWILNNGIWQANASMRAPIFYDSEDTGYYADPNSISRMNTIVYDNLKFSGDQTYGLLGRNAYVDTINGRGADPLELNYYDGGSVIIGTGANGSKALYAGSLYDAGNRVYSAGNPQTNISGSAGTVTGSSTIGGYLTLNVNWGVSPYTAAFNIVGTHPSMVFRGSNGDTHYLIHMDSAGDIQYYFGPGYTTNNWTQRYTFTKGGNFSALTGNISASGTISASNFSGSHSGSSSGTNTGDQTNISGNAATATNSSQLNGISSTQIFNNMGLGHGTYQDFNSVGNFGVRYMQGSTNGPESGQHYGFTLGLGNDYGYGTYGTQFYWLRNTTNPYIRIRYQEGGSWGGWTKVSAGYADNAGNTNSVSNALGNTHTWTGAQNNFLGNGNTGGTNNVGMVVYSTGGNGSQFSFHRAGYYAINMGLDSDNVIRIGGWSASPNRFQMDMSGNLTMSGDITAYSDSRVKENIATIENALSKVLALRGVSYNRIDSDDKKTKIGVIAQETLTVVPEVVNQDNDGMYNVSYGNLAGLFIEAIKEQQKEIEELKTLIYGITR